MKQKQGLQFTIALLSFLFIAAFLYQINGKSIFGYQLKFVSTDDFKKVTPPVKKPIEHIISEGPDKSIEYPLKSPDELEKYVDSLIAVDNAAMIEADFKESPYLINAPINGIYPLDAFFENLSNLKESHNLLRVAHYGDSQTEGDRITSILRNLFQSKFGGNGVGYVPMSDITDVVTYVRNADAVWNRYTVFGTKLSGLAYGPGGSAYRYAPSTTAKVNLNLRGPYQKVNILYGFGNDDSYLEVYSANKALLGKQVLNNQSLFNKTPIELSSNEKYLEFVFKGNSPCIYGLTFDSVAGIQFDNYGLRAQAGEGLLTIPENQFIKMFEETQTKMAILQFGARVVSNLRNEERINFYGDLYKDIFLHFKKSMQHGSVLVVSVTDVARKVGGGYKSYSNISELRYLQRKFAVENGLAFFDIYQLTGGENSTSAWSEKGLAYVDGHYKDKGRSIVGKELYKALIFEYNKFLKRKTRVNE